MTTITISNGRTTEALTEHQIHLLRTALAYAAQQMRRDMITAREQFASTSARQWSRTSRKFSELYELIEQLDTDPDDDDEPGAMGAGPGPAPMPERPAAPDADTPDAAAS